MPAMFEEDIHSIEFKCITDYLKAFQVLKGF